MLRASILRARPALRSIAPAARPQWRVAQRFYADEKKPGETAIPNPAPTVPPSNPTVSDGISKSSTVQTTSSSRTAPVEQPATTPPTGPGSASVAPDPVQAPKPKKKRRIRRFLFQLILLSTLGYAGGVYYSLVSDNFHDFFTEFVPFGEDAVGYFEEREFRKRFPGRAGQPRLHPQVSGENKVTIPGKSGLSSRPAEASGSDLAGKGPHVSAVKESKPVDPQTSAAGSASKGAQESKKEAGHKEKPTESSSHDLLPKGSSKAKAESKAATTPTATASTPITQLDHLSVPSASEPVVQDVVKIVNDIITAINADESHGNKYDSALNKAKSELSKVVADINLLKESTQKSAEEQIKAAHSEFDSAAKELVRRLDVQMHDQETHWKEEYENERERLSATYKEKLQSELDAAHNVYEQRLKNELIEQSIALQKAFSASVRKQVEQEREGRLGRLNELSSSVAELEKLTAEWNSVIEANLKTQHMVVAVESVKAALENQVVPKPFTGELAALKEIAADDPVVSAAIASINPAAYQRGIPNSAQLIDRFRRVAHEVRKAALLPEDAGVASHIASLAMSKVLFKKSGLAVGQDVEAILARTEVLLEEGDLDAAAREINGLQGWAKVLSKDWLSDARRVLEVRQALDVIGTEARLQSLLVD
ncbi:hypothetical protein BU24DRAFT_416073 [Aaosphaeria arxii CBS 175.79]|uniref:MICOS complex subunit MIC60 n=1 Tax=Aaosphaeria arxii CBS 175.79 TaxID=1450172 RepID=A0A6A5Y524_9PLEO|nr:uncharacterized protein BU24DRAFT_416073 [Aaosphaeria arxii CBS 175.79]KAF2020366.1 hypothetical protein BU24DRAFT_416073 [Aaosphaeria arxii CBS 175.79]